MGWLADGAINSSNTQITSSNLNANLAFVVVSQVAKFWKIEEMCGKSILSIKNKMFGKGFKANYQRQFIKSIIINLGNSYKTYVCSSVG